MLGILNRAPCGGLFSQAPGAGVSARKGASGPSGPAVLFFDDFSSGSVSTARWNIGDAPIVENGEAVVTKNGATAGNFQLKTAVPSDHVLSFDVHLKTNGNSNGGIIWLRSHEGEISFQPQVTGDALTGVVVQFNRNGGGSTSFIGFSTNGIFHRVGANDYTFHMEIRMEGNNYTFKIGETEQGPYADAGHANSTCWHYFIQGDIDYIAFDNIRITELP